MKKISLVLALLLIFSLLASCNEGDTPPENTTTAVTTTAATTDATTVATTYPPDLKTTSAFDDIEIKAGTDVYDIFKKLVDDPNVIRFGNNFMFTNSNYENVVIQFNSDNDKIIRMEKYPWTSAKDLSGLKNGMPIFDVVALIGLPVSDGINLSLVFKTPEGDRTIRFILKGAYHGTNMYLSDPTFPKADESMILTTSAFDKFDLKPGPIPIGFFKAVSEEDPAVVAYTRGYNGLNFIFFTNTDKEIVVVELDGTHSEIVRVEKYSWRTAERYAEYNKDMSIYEMVELLGMPSCISGSGFITLDYETPAGIMSLYPR
ncbi:MAG: hypothetical protein E7641_00370 [Ruminococcaceae bacterium]|nr:hypothetical protein [Oscillospiraceae bacterium]